MINTPDDAITIVNRRAHLAVLEKRFEREVREREREREREKREEREREVECEAHIHTNTHTHTHTHTHHASDLAGPGYHKEVGSQHRGLHSIPHRQEHTSSRCSLVHADP